MKFSLKIVLLLILLFTFSCAHQDHKLPKESNVNIVKNLDGNRWGNIYFSGQPSDISLNNLKAKGFKTVINLRAKKEGRYLESHERMVLKKYNLNYYNIPLLMNKDMTDDYISSVTSKIMKHKKEGKILVHCSSGNRVAIWLGGHFKKDHGFSNEKSLSLAKELGLTKEVAEKKLLSYLNR